MVTTVKKVNHKDSLSAAQIIRMKHVFIQMRDITERLDCRLRYVLALNTLCTIFGVMCQVYTLVMVGPYRNNVMVDSDNTVIKAMVFWSLSAVFSVTELVISCLVCGSVQRKADELNAAFDGINAGHLVDSESRRECLMFATVMRTSDVFIVGAKRTPFGSFGGALRSVTPTELAEIAARGALQAAKVGPELVQSVVVGNAIQISADDTPIIARGIVGRLGIPINVPGLSVNIQCGSGFQAIIQASQDIMLNDCEITLAVGVENMSLTPFMLRGARFGVKLSQTPPLIDALWEGLKDHNCNLRMGE
ncbi:unnamed protein product, partial [Medioppia subpectinata]